MTTPAPNAGWPSATNASMSCSHRSRHNDGKDKGQ